MSTIQVSLWRGKVDGGYRTYRVPQRDNQTVLDVVTWVQRNADPTLAYRFACRVGMCGSCAMTVNGRPRWTCRSRRRLPRLPFAPELPAALPQGAQSHRVHRRPQAPHHAGLHQG